MVLNDSRKDLAKEVKMDLDTTAREPKTCTFQGSDASNTTTKIPRKDPKREKIENCGGKGKKKARNFGPPTLRGSTLRGLPPFGTLRGLHPFVVQKFNIQKLAEVEIDRKSKLAEVEIGRSRNLPKTKKKLAEVRNWPKSIALDSG